MGFLDCRTSAGFLTRYERELREPLVWRQGSQVPMRWLGGAPYCSQVMVGDLFGLRRPSTEVCRLHGRANGDWEDLCQHASPTAAAPVSHPCGRPLSTHASAGDPQTFTGRSSSVSCGIKLGQGSSSSLYLLFLRSTKKLFPYFFGHFLGRN